MGRRSGWLGRTLLASGILGLAATTVIAAETAREYQEWDDRPLGVLEGIFGLQNAHLPSAPDWNCDYAFEPAAGPVPVRIYWDGPAYQARAASLSWEAELEHRIPVPFAVQGIGVAASRDAAFEAARASPHDVIVVLTETHFRGSGLNERLEGFACANIAVVNVHIDCPESIVAHEVGHVLGFPHRAAGLMKPKGVTCDARLPPSEVASLEVRLR